MKKIYLIFPILLFAFLVVAESGTFSFTVPEKPIEKPKNPQKDKPSKKKRARAVSSTVTVTKSFSVEGGGSVIPGAQLNYSILLSANSLASEVSLRDTLDPNLTLVTGSLKATPIAVNDAYSSLGNVGLNVNDTESGVLGNDISPDGKALSVTPVIDGTTAQNGKYSLAADGTFTYLPAAGFTGTDSFSYTAINADNLNSNEVGTVSITVDGLIYFVDASVAASGSGTLQSPFKTIADITGVDSNPIFFYSGNYTGGLTLSNTQKLIGQGAAQSIAQILSVSLPTFSYALPETGGTNPELSKTSATVLTLGSDNGIYGLNFSNTGVAATILGNSVGNLTVKNVSLNNTSGQALQITQGGVLDCVFTSISANNATKGISVNNSSGIFQIAGNGNSVGSGGTIQNITQRGVEFNNSSGITLKNLNFTNANTQIGTDPGIQNNSNVNAALYFNNVSGIVLDNIQVNNNVGTANARIGLNLYNCTDFTLHNSKILRSGTGIGSAGLYAVNTAGTNSITNSEIGKSSRGAHFINVNTNMTLNVSDSKFMDTRTYHDNSTVNADGAQAFLIEGFGTSEITANINQSEFLRYGNVGIMTLANAPSTITGNVIQNSISSNNANLSPGWDVGIGTDISSLENGGAVLFNQFENEVSGRQGPQMNVFTGSSSRAEGTIENNDIIYNYVGSVSNNSGQGVRLSQTSSTTTNSVKIDNNRISGINNSLPIDVLSSGISGGRLDAIVTNNTITVNNPTGNSNYAIGMTASDGAKILCSNVSGNIVSSGINGLAQFRTVSLGNTLMLEGNNQGVTTAQGVLNIWNNSGNTPIATGTDGTGGNVLSVGGSGVFTFGATCIAPANIYNPNLRIAASIPIDSTIQKAIALEDNKISNPDKIIQDSKSKDEFSFNKDMLSIGAAQDEDPQIIIVNGTGNGFNLPESKSTTITFSAIVSDTPTNCVISNSATAYGSSFVAVKSNISTANVIIPLPSAISLSKNEICKGESVTLSSTCSSGTQNWYESGDPNTIIDTGTSVIVSPTQTTMYEVACMVGGCESGRVSSSVTVLDLPSITVLESPDICNGATTFTIPYTSASESPISYSISGTGISGVTDENLPSSPITVNLINPATTDSVYSYSLTLKNAVGCVSNVINGSVSVFTSPIPENLQVSPAVLCFSGTVTLTAENCTGTLTWFDASDDSPIVGNQPNISVSKSYYSKCTENGCISEASETVSVEVINLNAPTDVLISDNVICETESVSLSATCSSGTVVWYSNDFGGASLGTGSGLSITPLSGIWSYYAACEGDGCSSSRTQTSNTVIVKPKPTKPEITAPVNTIICTPDTITLTATGCVGAVLWSDNSTSNPLELSAPGTYSISVKCVIDGCESDPSDEITGLEIGSIPSVPIVSEHHVCSGGDLTLTASCNTAGSSPVWFADLSGTMQINPDLTDVTASALYFVACKSSSALGCESEIIPVDVYVNTPLTYNGFMPENVYACESGDAVIVVDNSLISGNHYSYQWQKFNGTVFDDLSENGIYQNVTHDTLKINTITLSMNNDLFRVLINNSCNTVSSDTFSLKVNQLPVIITQPVGQVVCIGNQTTLSVEADGSGLSYRWQVNTGSGFVDLTNSGSYSKVNTPNLEITNIQHEFNNYQFRCIVFNGCQSVISNSVVIQIDPTINILSQPINRSVCQGSNTSFTVNSLNIYGGSITYQWQRSTNGGISFTDISNGSLYSGVNTSTLTLSNVPANHDGSRYRCVINGYCQSLGAELTVTPIATVVSHPADVEICEGNNSSFSVTARGIGLTYRWQVNMGNGFQNIYNGGIYDGATKSTLHLLYPSSDANGYQYRCLVWGISDCDSKADTSKIAILNVGISAEAYTVLMNSPISTDVGVTQAVGYILGINKVIQPNGKAIYRAGQAIILDSGFEVEAGAVFEARIKSPCMMNQNLMKTPNTISK